MGFLLDELRDDLRDHTGEDAIELTNPKADRYINRSWWQISGSLKFKEKEASSSATTVASTRELSLPVDARSIQKIVVVDPDTSDHIVLQREDVDAYESHYNADSDSEDIPAYYHRRDDEIILRPTPDAEYSVIIYYLKTLADIEASGPPIPQEWHEAILFGAVWRRFSALKDYEASNEFRKAQSGLIQSLIPVEAEEEVDSRYNRVEAILPEYP